MIRLLTDLFVSLALIALALTGIGLFRPPAHDGVWLAATIIALAALLVAVTIATLTHPEPSTPTDRNQE